MRLQISVCILNTMARRAKLLQRTGDEVQGENFGLGCRLGRHEYGGVDNRTGKPWSKIKFWFGYSLHVIGDTRYEYLWRSK